jgi:peptide/nickel transport system ATP-binding protein
MASPTHPAATSPAPLLEIRSLRVAFGDSEVVHGIDLAIAPGEVLGLVGESGSGKSITSLAILGLVQGSARISGSIRWQGRELLGLSQSGMRSIRGREIAMVFQEPMTALNPVMSIGRQITEAILAHLDASGSAISGREAKRRAIQALEEVSIPDASRRFSDYPHQFSGGQRQRILIAMALVHKPRLLIADEPTTALDVTVQAQVLTLLKSLQKEHNLAMLFTSHDLGVIGQVAGRVAVMRHGEVLETGPALQVLTRPTHPYTQSLLAAVPTLRTDRTLPLAVLAKKPAQRSCDNKFRSI